MMNLIDKNTRLHLVQKYLDAETSSQEEKMLADYYATSMADADEREIATLILSGSSGLDSIFDAGNKAFKDILAAERTHARRKRHFLRYSFLASAACIAALIFLFRNTLSTSDRSPALVDEKKDGMSPVANTARITDTPQEPVISETKERPAHKVVMPTEPDPVAENIQHQELRFEDVFPSSGKSLDLELMFEIEEELQQRLLTEALEKEVEARMASIIEERETVNL